ncbi:MAG TPA: ATP-binding protein [Micromonosporaceae bacterium]|jgi:anti-sigma regulatory factor (Ser/Thr protein kinase)
MTGRVVRSVVLAREVFNVDRLPRIREIVRWAAARMGISRDRTDRFLHAVCEAVNNSIVHGGGVGHLEMISVGRTSLIARVIDSGPGIVIPITFERPDPAAMNGRGWWLMQECCDRVLVSTGPTGTTVDLEVAVTAA